VLLLAGRSVIALAFGVGLTRAAGVEIAPPVLPDACRPLGILAAACRALAHHDMPDIS
jgi:hypothetical protein